MLTNAITINISFSLLISFSMEREGEGTKERDYFL